MYLLLWPLLLGLLGWWFQQGLDEQHNPNHDLAGRTTQDGARELELRGNRQGHYLLEGRINGHPLQMMLDTGASDISIPAALADTLGLERGAQVTYQTANGPIEAYRTLIDRLQLGPIELYEVRASLNPNMDADEEILVGMSALRHLELVQRDGRMLLRQP